MTKTITKSQVLDWLFRHDACEPAQKWAAEQATAQDILSKCPDTGWLVWATETIGGPARAEYQRVEGPAWAEYERVRGLAARQALTWERVVEAVLAG